MIEYLSYRYQLARLNKSLSKLLQEAELVEAGYKPGEDDRGHISYIHQRCHELEQWIEFHKTCYFKKKADKLLVPMPSPKDTAMYEEFDFGDENGPEKILTEKGIYHVRELIRHEQKARRDVVSFWFGVVTGLIGAVIGLVSVLKG